MTTQVLTFGHFGPPVEVVKSSEEQLPSLGSTDVKIAMRLSPINPSDINYIEGRYGLRPQLPAVGGLEGVGEIIEIGSQVENLVLGQLVRPDRNRGMWRKELIQAAQTVIPFHRSLTVEQAAVTSVNPPTAWCLLQEIVSLQPGDWVIQNAANSGVGRAVIQIARELGIRTLNIVRRPELVKELKAEGADMVILNEEIQLREAREQIGKASVKLALNAVGGESALTLAKFLSSGGTHVTYGAMAKQPVKIPNGLLIFHDITFRGFWVTRWLQQASPEKVEAMWAALIALWGREILTVGIEKTYPLEEFAAALTHAQKEARSGKILFQMK